MPSELHNQALLNILAARNANPVTFLHSDTATTAIYTLSLHDALPISRTARLLAFDRPFARRRELRGPRLDRDRRRRLDRKSTRLNSSHTVISYAVFCLKKKKLRLVYRSF